MVFSMPTGAAVTADAFAFGYLVGVALQGGNVLTWGLNNYGQNGKGSATGHFDPHVLTATPALPPMTAVTTQMLTTLMLDNGGNVWTLGWNDNGQAGVGSNTTGNCPSSTQQCENQPVKIPNLTSVVKIIDGGFNSAAITADGKLWMWGTNYEATLGHAPNTGGDKNCGSASMPLACATSPVQVTGVP
jgi:alpha-tubulin suppressor-like RCC1 family protein